MHSLYGAGAGFVEAGSIPAVRVAWKSLSPVTAGWQFWRMGAAIARYWRPARWLTSFKHGRQLAWTDAIE
jgi:hypothetical protein